MIRTLTSAFGALRVCRAAPLRTFSAPVRARLNYVHGDYHAPKPVKEERVYPLGYSHIHQRNPKRLEKAMDVKNEAMARWLPAARGNLKRQRVEMRSQSRRQVQRSKRVVYATRTQLNKLKKIMNDYVLKRRN